MKTQNLIAVASITVLVALAAALFAWRSQSPAVPDARLPAASAVTPAAGTGSHDVAMARSGAASAFGENRAAPSDPPPPDSLNRRCKNGFSIDRDPSGAFAGWRCNPSAYENYSTAALESLAYGDAEAASVLAYRLRHTDYPRALQLALRTTALSGGDTSTLTSALVWRPLLDEKGEPSLSGFGQAYVLQELINRLRNRSGPPSTYEKQLRRLADDPDLVLQDLDAIVDRMYSEIQEIELEITGSATIGGEEDA